MGMSSTGCFNRGRVTASRSVVSDSATLWTVAHHAPLSMGFSRQEYWSGLPFPPPGDLPDPGIHPGSPALAGGFFTIWATWEVFIYSQYERSVNERPGGFAVPLNFDFLWILNSSLNRNSSKAGPHPNFMGREKVANPPSNARSLYWRQLVCDVIRLTSQNRM